MNKLISLTIILLFPIFLLSQSRVTVEVELTGRIDTNAYSKEVVTFVVMGDDTTRVLSNYVGDKIRTQVFDPLRTPDEEIENIDQMIDAIRTEIEQSAFQIRLMRLRLVELQKDRVFNLMRKNRNGR